MPPRIAQLVALLLAVAVLASAWHRTPVCAGQGCAVAAIAAGSPIDHTTGPADSCCARHADRSAADADADRSSGVPTSPADNDQDGCDCGLGCCSVSRPCLLTRLAMPAMVPADHSASVPPITTPAAPPLAFHLQLLRPPRA